jgi:hypothetical protein
MKAYREQFHIRSYIGMEIQALLKVMLKALTQPPNPDEP